MAATLALLVIGGSLSTFVMFARSTVRISNYADMERQATRALELMARDIRMASKVDTDAATTTPGNAQNRVISQITLTVQNTSGGTNSIKYQFVSASSSLTRKVDSGTAETIVTDIASGTGRFYAYNYPTSGTWNYAANDLETGQIKVNMTVRPNTKGNYATTTKKVISARFVLRNET